MEFKRLFFLSVSHLYLGIQADEAQRMGERVARFQAAADQLEAAVKQSKTLDASGGAGLVDRGAIADAIQFANGNTATLLITHAMFL